GIRKAGALTETNASVFLAGRYAALAVHAEIPYVQVDSVRQDLREGIFTRWQLLSQRKSKNILCNVPSLQGDHVAIFRYLLSEHGSNRLDFPFPALHRQPHQFNLRPGFSRPAARLNRRNPVRVGRRFTKVKLRPL